MATISFDRKKFEKILGKKLSDKQIKEYVPMLGVGVEEITKEEITIEVNPNRPDLLSAQGFARALSSFMGIKKGLREYKVKKSDYKVIINKSLKNVRPYTACAVVKNINFTEERIKEVIQIQEKLHATYGRKRKKAAIGIYPFEKIKMPITFTAKDPSKIKFRPLEFPREINGKQILSQHPAGREYGDLLEGLSKYPFFIDAAGKVLSMPPVINSYDTGAITSKTKEVFIECSGFDYKTMSKIINMIVTSLADMGGEIYQMELVYPDKKIKSPDLSPSKMKLDLKYVNKIIGENLSEKQVKDCLLKMGFGYKDKNVLIPAYRTDIMHQIDLVEDIAIAYGYNNLEPDLPSISTVGSIARAEEMKNLVAEILVGLGLMETHTFCISNKEVQNKSMGTKQPLIELSNALSSEYDVLRAKIIPSLMEVLKINKHNDYPQKIFEIGIIFEKDSKQETNIKETNNLAAMICSADSNYTLIRQILDNLLSRLGKEVIIKDTEHNSFLSGRAGSVHVSGKQIGIIGEIHPQVLENFGIEMPVVAFEIDLDELMNLL